MNQILRAADLGQRTVLVEQILQRHRVGDLPALDQFADRRIDTGVHSVAEMLRLQEFRHPGIGRVVDQQGAQQRLLGLAVIGRGADQLGVGVAQRRDAGRGHRFHVKDYHLPRDEAASRRTHTLCKAWILRAPRTGPLRAGFRRRDRRRRCGRAPSRACSRGSAVRYRPPWRAASETRGGRPRRKAISEPTRYISHIRQKRSS